MRHRLILSLLLAACGTGHNGFDGGVDSSVNDSAVVPDTVLNFPETGLNDSGACTQCSADLHSVLTCGSNPTVVATCTGDQGCGVGGCVPACQAAADNKSSVGCDYYTTPSDGWNQAMGSDGTPSSCFAAFVANNWSTDMNVTLTWKGKTINGNSFAYIPKGAGSSITYTKIPSSGIPANSMAIVFLNDYPAGSSCCGEYTACPAGTTAAVTNEDVLVHSTAVGNAMEIQTSVPGVIYDIYPFGGANSYISSATLLLPTTAWDTNYVATTMSESVISDPQPIPNYLSVVAQQDGTTVTILPTVAIVAGTGVKGSGANTPVSYTINKGQMLHFVQPITNGLDLTGSIIQSNYPVGLWGGHVCETAENPPKWRLVGAVDGTTLTYDPPNALAPKTVKQGQLVEFDGPGAFHVSAQDDKHPFYLAAHRPAGDCDSAHQEIPPIKALGNDYVAVGNESTNFFVGGPETVNVVPPAQFLPSYIFFTDPTYGYTEIALTRQKASDNTFHDVTVDCVGKVTGWQNVDSKGQYQYVHVDFVTGGTPVGKCNNGLHTASSDTPFGITVWGYDSASSYAYPAGASVKPINTVVVLPTPH